MALPAYSFMDSNVPTYFGKFKTIVLCEFRKISIVSEGILDAHLQKDGSKVICSRNGKLWKRKVNPPVVKGRGTHDYQHTKLMIPLFFLFP